MKIFLSWSGPTSRAFAHKAQEFFAQILPWSEIYLSDDDIESGERWLVNISNALEGSSYGIIFLTNENKVSPWVLFEAGALSKSISDARVVPLLCDIEDIDLTGNPLSQFQYRKLSKGDVERLLKDINAKSDISVPWDRIAKTFEKFWPDFEPDFIALQEETAKKVAEAAPSTTAKAKPASRVDVEQLQESLNEILRSVRSTQRAASGRLMTSPRVLGSGREDISSRRRTRRVDLESPDFYGEIEPNGEIGHLVSMSTGDKVATFVVYEATFSQWIDVFTKALQRELDAKPK